MTYLPPSVTLTRLSDDHAPALLAFELENRAYFARSVPDRGDDYFTHFASRHAALTRNGFVAVGDIELDGRPGTRYQLRLSQ